MYSLKAEEEEETLFCAWIPYACFSGLAAALPIFIFVSFCVFWEGKYPQICFPSGRMRKTSENCHVFDYWQTRGDPTTLLSRSSFLYRFLFLSFFVVVSFLLLFCFFQFPKDKQSCRPGTLLSLPGWDATKIEKQKLCLAVCVLVLWRSKNSCDAKVNVW